MKVIQIRGTNATGKTTTIRQFIENGDFCVESIEVGKREVEYHWEEKRRVAVIGRYDKAVTGGVDGYITDKNQLANTILKMVREIRPNALLFEGIVYGVTFKFAYELAVLLKKLNCEYIGLCFYAPLDVVFDRLAQRNGGKEVDYMSVQSKWFTSSRAYEKLKKYGINVKAINTTNIPKNSMYKIIEDVL